MLSGPNRAKRTAPRLLASLLGVTVLAAVSLILGVSTASATPSHTSNGELWTRRYDGGGHADDWATSMIVSPDGSRVYVTGSSQGYNSGPDISTSAYDAATGARVWTHRYDGQEQDDYPSSIAISPDGTTVYVTGWSLQFWFDDYDYVTLAYDAATGSKKWVRYFDGGGRADAALSIAVSPDGETVYVTGNAPVDINHVDAATIAYAAERGTELWVSRYHGGDLSGGTSLAVSPDGSRIYVTGSSNGGSGGWGDFDYATISYDASDGAELWVARYNFAEGTDSPTDVAVSPDGALVFVTGESRAPTWSSPDVATVAYHADTGDQAWVQRYAGPGGRYDRGNALAVSIDGTLLFVAGFSERDPSHDDYLTVAYDTLTGQRSWVHLYDGPRSNEDAANSVAVSPDGSMVYVTGASMGLARNDDYATIAYDGATGAKRWIRRYNGPAHGADSAYAVAVAPDGSRVYVTGGSDGVGNGQDFATLAYPA
jgi:DNA-binding beta-propeller fold protein YncE